MFVLLDTSILIDLIKNQPPQVAERFDAHALALDATLLSHHVSAFARIEGLRLEDWVTRDGEGIQGSELPSSASSPRNRHNPASIASISACDTQP